MSNAAKRRLFSHVNRFQRPIINVVLTGSFLTLFLALCMAYISTDTTYEIAASAQLVPDIKIVVLVVLLLLPLIFYAMIVWGYYVSNKLVGPFERILRELDEIIATKQKRHVHTRKGDKLAEELLKRINILIDRMD